LEKNTLTPFAPKEFNIEDTCSYFQEIDILYLQDFVPIAKIYFNSDQDILDHLQLLSSLSIEEDSFLKIFNMSTSRFSFSLSEDEIFDVLISLKHMLMVKQK